MVTMIAYFVDIYPYRNIWFSCNRFSKTSSYATEGSSPTPNQIWYSSHRLYSWCPHQPLSPVKYAYCQQSVFCFINISNKIQYGKWCGRGWRRKLVSQTGNTIRQRGYTNSKKRADDTTIASELFQVWLHHIFVHSQHCVTLDIELVHINMEVFLPTRGITKCQLFSLMFYLAPLIIKTIPCLQYHQVSIT